ncbi:hypothetical protein BU23DRAFT_70103 [Bimuria novae-zelandiae CBS 107.79]|uniref:Uncharacterized protein n=1 Tax=Bimuria novae-zelandiae CBS 107.79 TaxID=1447943 RepID=A0A6A5UT40_9PLEO|nr:hypothetical protein BU23DRAFT_70103 [Bimuria novae-zelandiae CBS 107.79]
MVAASSPFGLSKAALERRINNQIPRKRHTPYPASKNSNRTIAKHLARPKPTPTPVKPLRKRDLSVLPQARPEKRGTDRNRTVGTTSHGINQWSARRILAARPHPSNPTGTQYKVQWETTWEDATDITGLAAVEWKEAVHCGNTFQFQAQNGSEWTVLKDMTCLENDSEDSQWEMWKAIRRNAVQEVDKDWFARLSDEEYTFASAEDEREVCEALKETWPEKGISTRNVLRAAWSRLNNDPNLQEADIPLGHIKVRFSGQLDPWVDEDEALEGSKKCERAAYTVAEIVRAILPNPLDDLEDEAFSKGDTHSNFSRWREVTRLLICKAPFLFKSGKWMQLFAFLMLGSEMLRETLVSIGIKVQDDWCQRAKEYDMHMYYDCIVDDRPTHDIQETFIHLRDFFRELDAGKANETSSKEEVRSLRSNIDEGILEESVEISSALVAEDMECAEP